MRINIAAVTFVCLCLSSAVFGQSAVLKGKVVDDKENSVSGVRILTPDGQADETDSKGQFTIAFPTTVQPGQATRIELRDKPGWVIYEPLLGNCVTQSTARNFEPLKVIIVPKGSLLALSPKRLSQVIARWSNERVQLRSQVKEQQSQLDEYAFLREYAEKYGFTLEQFREAADQWANGKIATDKLEAGWQEYWKKNYDRAAQLGYESRIIFKEKLNRDKKKRLEDGHQFIRSAKLEGDARYAKDKFREALTAYQEIEMAFKERELIREDIPVEWASNQLSLASAKRELGERVEGLEGQRLLAEAVFAHYEAFKVYTREQLPQQWAMTQNNLAAALCSQGERSSGAEGVKLLTESVAAYRESLKVRIREHSPQDWACTLNDLGTALRSLGIRSNAEASVKLLAESVAAYREALEVRTREQFPREWAMTQNNLGVALSSQAEHSSGSESVRLLAAAATAHREALKIYTREQSPLDWAMTQNNLGTVLWSQGEGSSNEDRARLLAEAVTAYRESLKVRTREQSPQQWALTQNNLGVVLRSQGERLGGEEGIKLLGEAISACHEALKVHTREQLPQHWAASQVNLATALMRQGEKLNGEGGVKLLAEAVTAVREALKVHTHEHSPQAWVDAQNTLGVALISQGMRKSGEDRMKLLAEAVTAFREVLKAYTFEHSPQGWAMAQINLGTILRMQSEQAEGKEKPKLLAEAVLAFREALKVYIHDQLPQNRMMIQVRLVNACELLANAYYILKDWENAAISYADVMTLAPKSKQGYQRLGYIYREQLFDYAMAFGLHSKWIVHFPNDLSALANLVETSFTTGRFAEFSPRLKTLLANPELPAATKIALQMIEVANLLALGQAAQVPAVLAALLETIAAQPTDCRITWSFTGTLHFINQEGKLAPYCAWLNQFFEVAQAENRDAISKALRGTQAQFKPIGR